MRPRNKPLTRSQISTIKQLRKKGWSERKIAEKIGCSRSTVWYWLQQ